MNASEMESLLNSCGVVVDVQSVSLRLFTLRLKPTAKNLSGHISGHVQLPNCSPLLTVSMDLYCLLLKAMPARCRAVFSSAHRPLDSTASRDTTGNRKVISSQTAELQHIELAGGR